MKTWWALDVASDDNELFGRHDPVYPFFKFLTRNRGWMASPKGIWLTDDGADTWRMVFRGTSWRVFEFHNATDGIITLVESIDRRTLRSYRTRDAGTTWEPCGTPDFDLTPQNYYFLNSNDGWGLAHINHASGKVNDILVRTTDGGCSWKKLWLNTRQPEAEYRVVYFLNAHDGYLIEEDEGEGSRNHFYRTYDGGKSWSKWRVAFPERVSVGEMFFENRSVGWILGFTGEPDDAMLNTQDGGKTWRRIPTDDLLQGLSLPTNWKAGNLFEALYTLK